MTEEFKNREIENLLKKLPGVKASDDFEDRLFKKIAEIEYEKQRSGYTSPEKNSGILHKFFGGKNPWLVPALGLSIVVLFTVYITYTHMPGSVNEVDMNSKSPDVKSQIMDTIKSSDNRDLKNTPETVPQATEEKTKEGQVSPSVNQRNGSFKSENMKLKSEESESKTDYINDNEETIKKETEETLQEKNPELIIPESKTGNADDAEVKDKISAPPITPDAGVDVRTESTDVKSAKEKKDSLNKLDSLSKMNLKKLREKLIDK